MLHVFTISSWRSPVAAQLRFVRFFVLALAERSSSQPQALSGYGGRSQGSNPWQTQVMVLGVPLLEYGNGRRMVQTFCPSVLGVPISLGAIQKVLDRVAEALAPHYFAIATQTRHAPVNYIDETPRFLANALQGLWVMVSDTAAFYMIHPHRSKEAFAALIDDWAGILVSAGYGVYENWAQARQTCLAHLIQTARSLAERQNAELAACGAWGVAGVVCPAVPSD